MPDWSVYLIRLQDGQLYTGIAVDVAKRFQEHSLGGKKGAKFLRGRGPLRLVFEQRVGSRSAALKAEARIKKLPKASKEELIHGRLRLDSLLEGTASG